MISENHSYNAHTTLAVEDGNFSRHQPALGGPGGDKVPSGMGVLGATDTAEGCYAALRVREARALGRGLALGAVLHRTHVRRAWLETACWRGRGGGQGKREQQQKHCPIAWGAPRLSPRGGAGNGHTVWPAG